jgi:hypothetical protein
LAQRRLIAERAWAAQITLGGNVAPSDAQALTDDAPLLLVDNATAS